MNKENQEKKIQKRTIENREKLLSASMKQFSTKGYYNTNIRGITQEAGLSTGIFYRYFENKESLYLTLVEEYFEQSAKLLDELLQIGLTTKTKDEAREILQQNFSSIINRSSESIVFVSDIDIVRKELPALEEVQKKGVSLLHTCFEQFLRKQYPDSQMNYALMARMIHIATDAIGRDLSKENSPSIKAEYLRLFIEQILYYAYDLK